MNVGSCSMKTLAAIHTGCCGDLISRTEYRCATPKEPRKLVLLARETPLGNNICSRKMLDVS